MDKHNFPPLEPDKSQPEYLPVFPEKMESLDDQPVIQELFFQEAPVSADVQANWEEPSAEAEESVAESLVVESVAESSAGLFAGSSAPHTEQAPSTYLWSANTSSFSAPHTIQLAGSSHVASP